MRIEPTKHPIKILLLLLVLAGSLRGQDTIPPVITIPGISKATGCEGSNINGEFNQWYNTAGGTVAFDNSGSYVLIANIPFNLALSRLNQSADTLCGNTKNVVIEFRALDPSNNVSEPVIISFSVIDTLPPIIFVRPESASIECTAGAQDSLNNWIKAKGGARASDICSSTVIWDKFYYQTSTGERDSSSIANGPYPQIPPSACNWNVLVSFKVLDECGNQNITPIRTFEVKDTKAPVFSNLPSDITVSCDKVPLPAALTAEDACAGERIVTFMENSTKNPSPVQCSHYNYTLTRKWTVSDLCGNTASHIQTIVVKDTIAPEISGISPLTVSCDELNITDSLLQIKKDACGPIFLSYQDTFVNGSTCLYQIRRTYSASDVCGNTIRLMQVLNVRDDVPPKINVQAQNQSLECDMAGNAQSAFSAWINNRAGSLATDECNSGLRFFAAVPGSYVPGDTTTYPGVAPGQLDLSTCPSPVAFFTRGELVDFVYYDLCGNTSVTSAFFGLRDNTPPVVNNCVSNYTFQTAPGACSAEVNIPIPEAMDNCAQFNSPIVRTASAAVTSAMPGSNESVVFNVNLNFGPYPSGSIAPVAPSTLRLELLNIDGDDVTEFFNIIDEDGNLLGKTNNTDDQCGESVTEYNDINEIKISQWLSDGAIQFTLIPNNPGTPVLAINDVCTGAKVKGILSIPIDANNVLTSRFTIEGSGDTLQVSPPSVFMAQLPAGEHTIAFLYNDCGSNITKCVSKVVVKDELSPVITCPSSIANLAVNDSCIAKINLPLGLFATDNCGFPSVYDEILPVSNEARKIQFRLNESSGFHLALNKSITFPAAPLVKFHDQPVIVEVRAFGDLNDITEFFDIIGEGGYLLGKTNASSSSSCGISHTRFEIASSLYNTWAADGEINITAVANNMPGEEGNGINPCNPLSPSQTIDSSSFLTVRLVVGNPVFTYSIDGGTPFLLPVNDTLQTGLGSGQHIIKFEAADSNGNKSSCNTSILIADNKAPEAKCKGFVVRLHPSGSSSYLLHPDSINNGSKDNCEIDTSWVVNGVFDCDDIGRDKTAILFVKDKSGNVASCSASIRIEPAILNPYFKAGLCEGDTLKLFSNIPPGGNQNQYTYEWYRNDILVSNLENPEFLNAGSGFNGIYRIVAKGLNGCYGEGLVTVNIQPLTTPGIETEQDNYCDTETILLNTNAFTGDIEYEWYEGFPPNGVLIGVTNSPQFSVQPAAGIHNYYVIAKSESCISNPSPTRRLTIYKKPVVNLLSSFENVCTGDDIQLGTTTTGQNFSYQWTGPDGFSSTLANPPSIAAAGFENQGKYQLIISIQNCKSDTAITNVVILPTPDRPLITGENIYCEGTTFSLVVNNLPVQEKYTWFKDGEKFRVTTDNSLEILNVSTSATGKWTVIAESNGCESDTSEIKFVSIDNLSVIGADNSGPACEGDTIDLNATFVPNSTYQWSGPGNFSATGQFVKAPAKSGDYFVTITTTTGCENITSTAVEVNKAPVITALSNNSANCMDGKTDILFSPSVFPAGNYDYKWAGPNNFSQSVANAIISNATPEINGNYILTVFNKNCPSEPDTNRINIQLIPPAAAIIAPVRICEGDSLVVTTNAAADVYEWHTPNGIFQTTQPRFTIANVSEGNEGNYHCLVKKGDCFSTAFDVRFVTVDSRPLAPGIDGEQTLCFGDTLNLKPNVSGIQDANWKGPNGIIGSGINLVIPGVKEINEGGYQVSILKDGCFSPFSQLRFIEVKDSIPTAIPAVPVLTLCKSEESIASLCIKDYNPLPGYIYEWQLQNGTLLGSTIQQCLEVSNGLFADGEQFIEIWATKDGCRSLNPGNLVVTKRDAPPFIADAGTDETTVCGAGEVLQLNAAHQSPDVDVSWSSIAGDYTILTPNSSSTLVTDFKPGLNLLVLSYSKDGCVQFSSDTVRVFLLDTPVANNDNYTASFNTILNIDPLANDDFGAFYTVKFDSPVAGKGEIEASGTVYRFIPATGYAGNLSIKYELCVEGCPNLCDEATINFLVGIEVPCQPPNIFTPNGDGINDYYVIPCIETGRFEDNELIIFNQWGDQVYQAKPYDNSWDGTYGGNALPSGTYFYIFNPGQNSTRQNGFIIIQR